MIGIGAVRKFCDKTFWKAFGASLCIGVGVASLMAILTSCSPNIFIGGPSQVTQVTGGGGGALPSPAPGSGDGIIDSVKIGMFGSCAGVTADHTVKVGCTIPLTCSPKDAQGKLLPPAVTGTSPEFFGVVSGSQFVRAAPWDDEAFNLNVMGVAPGRFILQCIDKGKKSDPWEGEVVS